MTYNFPIVPLTEEHYDQVARIHRSGLPDDFCSLLGIKFLEEIFYPELLSSPLSFGLCSLNNERVSGFVVFTKDHDFFNNLIKSHFLVMLRYTARRLIHISFIKYVVEVVLLIFFKKRTEYEVDYELSYIAVHSEFQGHGIGSQLVREGLEQLKSLRAGYCWVKTLTNTPETIRFYEKLGFSVFQTFIGRTYLKRILSPKS